MTGGRGGGGSGRAPRDAWRGVRESSRGSSPRSVEPDGSAWRAGPEVEELPAQPVLRRGSPRLGLGGTLAIAGMVALLAAGFGLLGGRPDTQPVPTSAAIAPSPGLTEGTVPPPVPRVTPWIECGDAPARTPSVVLQVDGRPIAGTIEILEGAAGVPQPTSRGRPGPSIPTERTVVPVDVNTEIWIEDGVCALAWTIDLVDDHGLEVIPNTTRNPAYAAQNRFDLELGAHPAGDHDLRAELVFPTLVARITWPLRIQTIGAPTAVVRARDVAIRAVEGCDVSMTLATGWSNALNPCADDVGEPPRAAPVQPGERLAFELEDWRMDWGGVTCGRLLGQSFFPGPEAGCTVDVDPALPFFTAPSRPGRWTLAMSACGSHDGSAVATLTRLCGTWYATIVVEG